VREKLHANFFLKQTNKTQQIQANHSCFPMQKCEENNRKVFQNERKEKLHKIKQFWFGTIYVKDNNCVIDCHRAEK